ncbi:CMP-N-acetylneuraminate-beta-galactosamide-alpha-2,3-sialyltransferase 1-like [Oscarella lobularis]|uniref:CMP-N-acetylneuraminate-beta-galactosamide- alpha-2,3-sialyltransferase 1-like n=1 Tax=Oscarella lobularis TaxID=121494 RepID=UPI00331321FC
MSTHSNLTVMEPSVMQFFVVLILSLFATLLMLFATIHLPNVSHYRRTANISKSNTFELSCHGPHSLLVCSNNARNYDELYFKAAQFATDDDFITEPLLRRFHDTCAVVGSSGNLLNYEFGAEIDSRDVVFRINLPPIKGYEKYVGCREGDVLVLNSFLSHWPCHDVKRFFVTSHRNPTAYAEFVRNCWTRYRRKTYGMGPRVFELSNRLFYAYGRKYGTARSRFWVEFKWMFPTSGFDTVVFALHLCREVHMYGFGLREAKRFEYFNNATVKEFGFRTIFLLKRCFLPTMLMVGMIILSSICRGRDTAN